MNAAYSTIEDRHIARTVCIEKIKQSMKPDCSFLFVQAKPGSGKSVFARQYAESQNHPFLMYHLSEEDNDPQYLLSALLKLLGQQFKEIHQSDPARSLVSMAVQNYEVESFAFHIAQHLQKNSNQDSVSIIIDNFHILDNPTCQSILLQIWQKSPMNIEWIIVSRTPLHDSQLERLKKRNPHHVTEHDLRFSEHEIAQLFLEIHSSPVSREEVKNIQEACEGWPMGIAFFATENAQLSQLSSTPNSFGDKKSLTLLENYFSTLIFDQLEKEDLDLIQKASVVKELSPKLCEAVFSCADGQKVIQKIIRLNPFLQCTNAAEERYKFHDLFFSIAQCHADQHLDANERDALLLKAKDHYLAQGKVEVALWHVSRCSSPNHLEEVLAQYGMNLLHQNRIFSLHKYLSKLSERQIKDVPMNCFLYGACLQDLNPLEARNYLNLACSGFEQQSDIAGELMVRCQLIDFYILISGELKQCEEHITTIETKLNSTHDEIDEFLKARVCYVLAEGYIYVLGDLHRAGTYLDKAEDLALKNNIYPLLGGLSVIRGYWNSFQNNWPGILKTIENTAYLMDQPEVSNIAKLFIKLVRVNLLQMLGDFDNYARLRNSLERDEHQEIIKQSILLPFLYIFDVDMYIAQGRYGKALELIKESTSIGGAFNKPHTRSQFLHYRALIHAIKGDKEEALNAYEESLTLRYQVGGKAFIIFNHQMLGITCLHLDLFDKAMFHFKQADEISAELNIDYKWVNVDAHMAYYWISQGEEVKSISATEACLKYLKEKKQNFTFSWIPGVMETVLEHAVQNEIEKKFALEILTRRFDKGMTSQNAPIPLLHLSISDKAGRSNHFHLNIADLQSKQRQFFLALIFSRKQEIKIDEIKDILWPEKDSSKQRSSFDNLISTLRKHISQAVHGVETRNYLQTQNGKILLLHCRIDAIEFLNHLQRGKKHLSIGNTWQASNSFYLASSLWNQISPDYHIFFNNEAKLDMLISNYLELCERWGKILLQEGNLQESQRVLERGFHLNPNNIAVARTYYEIFKLKKDNVRCNQIVDQLKHHNEKLGESENEINIIVQSFWEYQV